MYIDDIAASLAEAVDHAAVSVAELSEHDVEDMFAHIEPFEHVVFVEMGVGAAGQVGVTNKGLKQYQLFILDLLHLLH